jgi:hypothetical protein
MARGASYSLFARCGLAFPGLFRAHEMAHFILNKSFSRRPPAPLQEEWAQSVEANNN